MVSIPHNKREGTDFEYNYCCGTVCDKGKMIGEFKALQAENARLINQCRLLKQRADRHRLTAIRLQKELADEKDKRQKGTPDTLESADGTAETPS